MSIKKRALITGFTGMVGSYLTDYILYNTDWEIYGVLREKSSLDNVNHLINKSHRVHLIYCDINDMFSIDFAVDTVKPDYVFHLAAQSSPRISFESPIDTLNTNILGTTKLLEALKKCKNIDPITHICSSSEVFGRVSKEKLPINEECLFHPVSPYGISKIGTDLIGRYYAEAYGMKIMTTRTFTHTGPRRGDNFAESTFAKQIAMIEAGLIPPVVKTGNLSAFRTWVDVRDIVRAYYMLVTVNPIPGEYYNIGGTFTCSIEDMLKTLLDMSTVRNIRVEIDQNRLKPIDFDLQVPDTTKFEKHTGWKAEIPFNRTMKDLLDYWRGKINDIEIS